MMIKSDRIFLKALEKTDLYSFINFVKRSQKIYEPWVSPPTTEKEFFALLEKNQQPNFKSFGIYHIKTNIIIGNINLSEIVGGNFQSAYLSYYIDSQHTNKGIMTEALKQLINYAFNELGLHRLEANIQPENKHSIALVKSCGFMKEGYSPKYLKIQGEWKDHERWAIVKK